MEEIKVLIVEDNAIIALQLKLSLRRAGYAVFEPVASGIDAINAARQENPDYILMDIRLFGNMDGVEAAQQISGFSKAKIIFTTGHSDQSLKDRAMALKPAAYLVKPVEVHDILPVIKQQMSRK